MSSTGKKKSVLLLIAGILGLVYTVYLIAYFTGAVGDAQTGSETLGAAIAGTLVAPHAVCVGLATVFSFVAWAVSSRGLALTGGILFAVSIVLFPPYFMFVVVQSVLAFVGFARLPKKSDIH